MRSREFAKASADAYSPCDRKKEDAAASPPDAEASPPTAPGAPFPSNFRETIGNIFRRLFRVYGHIYHCHMERVVELTFEAHLNSCFKHFAYFVLEFDLIRPEELKPLQSLIDKMVAEDDLRYGPRQRPIGAERDAAARSSSSSSSMAPPGTPAGASAS